MLPLLPLPPLLILPPPLLLLLLLLVCLLGDGVVRLDETEGGVDGDTVVGRVPVVLEVMPLVLYFVVWRECDCCFISTLDKVVVVIDDARLDNE